MENICNSYRDIVERAIFYGVINEEHRDFYLSAIDDENNSYLSEAEYKMNEKETFSENSPLKHGKDCNNTLIRASTNANNDYSALLNKQTKRILGKLEAQLSMDSIENRSILDLKSRLETVDTTVDESESDTLSNQRKNKSSPNNSLICTSINANDYNIPLNEQTKRILDKLESQLSMDSIENRSILYFNPGLETEDTTNNHRKPLTIDEIVNIIEADLSMDSIENRSILDFKSGLEAEDTTVVENELHTPNNQRKFKSCPNITLISTDSNVNDAMSILLNTRAQQCLDNTEAQLSGNSIENRSILDFKSVLETEDTTVHENESDTPNTQWNEKSSLNEYKNAVCKAVKVMKKPLKYQIIDFNVPIYKNLRYDNPSIKDSVKYRFSKMCHCHADKNSVCKQSQKSRQGNIRNKPLIFEKDESKLSRKPENHLKPNDFYSRDSEIDVKTYEDVDCSVKRKSIHTCSDNKNSSRASKRRSPQKIEKGSHTPLYSHKKHRADLNRRSKVHNDDEVTNVKTDHGMKQNLIDYQVFNILNSDINKAPSHPRRRLDMRNFRSKAAKSQSLYDDSTSDCDDACMSSEKESPLPNSCLKRSQNKCSDKFFNLKIICHLHPVEMIKTDGNQDSYNGTDEKETKEGISESKNHTQAKVESINAKDGKKTQLFSRMLSTLKINRKPKKS